MKRVLVAFAIIAVVFGIAACGESSSSLSTGDGSGTNPPSGTNEQPGQGKKEDASKNADDTSERPNSKKHEHAKPVEPTGRIATGSQENALKAAESYLEYSPFSKSGLEKQLKFEGFSSADARFGAAHVGANWNEQAIKAAASYLEYSPFSESGLVQQLEFEGFTSSQAQYGASKSYPTEHQSAKSKPSESGGSSSTAAQENALRAAESYLGSSAFSRSGLEEQLKFEGFSSADTKYAAANVGANWNEQAAKAAKSYLQSSSFSESGLREQLEFEGFTSSQAEYGVSKSYR